MSADAIAAGNNQFRPALMRVGHWRRIGFERFGRGFGWTNDFPKVFAGIGCQREQIGFPVLTTAPVHWHIALEHQNVKAAIVEHWTGAVGPLVSEVAVILLDISPPKFFARCVQTNEITCGEEEPGAFAVGQWR